MPKYLTPRFLWVLGTDTFVGSECQAQRVGELHLKATLELSVSARVHPQKNTHFDARASHTRQQRRRQNSRKDRLRKSTQRHYGINIQCRVRIEVALSAKKERHSEPVRRANSRTPGERGSVKLICSTSSKYAHQKSAHMPGGRGSR